MSRASNCIEKISSKGYKNRDGSPVLTPEDFQRVGSAADPVAEVMKMMGENTRFNDATDAAYLAAVERGDMETAQRMVDEAAKAAGYNVGPVYHGTRSTFDIFDTDKQGQNYKGWSQNGPGFYFASDKEHAGMYGAKAKGSNPVRTIAAHVREDGSTIRTQSSLEDFHIMVRDPAAVKSADPVTRDDQGNVIPLSQRFLKTSPDIRYSTIDPARQQVFGVENAGAVKPERSMKDTQANVRQNYFNGSTPVTPDATAQAFDLAYQWSDELTGQQVVADLMILNGGDALVVGVAQGELMTYAVAMSKAGDNSLLNFMNASVNTWAAFADTAAGMSEVGATLAGRSAYPMSAFMDAVTRVGKDRTKAIGKTLPPATTQAITKTVGTTKLDPKAVRKVKGNVKDKQGESLEEKVEKNVADVTAQSLLERFATSQSDTLSWMPKGQENKIRALVRRALTIGPKGMMWDRPWLTESLIALDVTPELAAQLTETVWAERKRLTGIRQARAAEQAAAKEKRDAERKAKRDAAAAAATAAENEDVATAVIDQLATLQSDTPTNKPKPEVNAVRALVKQALDPAAMWTQPMLVEALGKLNVSQETAVKLTAIVWAQRQKNGAAIVAKKEEQDREAAEALAEGTAGSLRGLEDALLAAPASQQQNVKWRYDTAEKYFQQLGLSPQRAAAAARAYNVEFGARLADALANAIERVAATSAPWQKKLKNMSQGQRKKALTGMEKLLRAVRVGVTKNDEIWHNVVARQNGWRGFTNEQNVRLHEIDDALASESIADYQKKALMAELQTIVDKAKIPPSFWDNIVASYTLSALCGLPTVFVQTSAPFSIFRDFISDLPSNPTVAARALIASMESLVQEASYALQTDVHNHQVGEHIRDSMPAMKMMLEEGIADWHSTNLTTRAKGFLKIIVGAQNYIGRLLNSIDEGSIAASEIYKTSMFTTRQLRTLGWTRNQAGGVVLASLDARNSEVAAAMERGLSRAEATVSANEIFRKRIHEGISVVDKEMADDVVEGAAREGMGMVGRLSDGVNNMEEGFLRTPITYLLDAIGKMYSKGGATALAARLLFGFVTIPFRAAMWYSGYSPYGLIRIGIHKAYQAKGMESPYQQSMATRAQEQQRLRDAIVGSIAMAVGVLLRSNSGDDDLDEAALFKFIVTGKGPKDVAVKQAWNKRFQPYSLNFKFGKTYVHFNLGRVGESLAWPLALAGALDDVSLDKKGKLARNPGATFRDTWEIIGSYWGSLSQRASFQSIGKAFGTADRGQNATMADRLFSQVTFSASAFMPWKGAMSTVTRMASDPVDNKTMSGVIWSNTPIVGPMLGRPALNNLGDPLGDRSAAGRLYREGLPMVVRFPASADSRVYDLIIDQGRGPSAPSRTDLEQQYGPLTPEQFYNFSKERGRLIKEEMNTRYEDLRKMDSEKFGNAMERIGRNAKRKAAQSVALKKVTAPAARP